MSASAHQHPNVVDPYDEALAYEYLYSMPRSSLRAISAQTANRGILPSEALDEVIVFPDEYSKIKAFFDDHLGSFDVAVGNTPSYPARLADANERPPLIYYRGNINLIGRKSVSVVGARAASRDGLARAARLARILAQNGITVVSGLAAGIDTAALTSCIEHGGSAIGVLGTPINEAYPKQNIELQQAIARDHLLVSQVPFYRYAHQPFSSKRRYFRERNVTMAAISSATVMVEASDKSGSLIQAGACIEQGRSLFIMRSCLDNPDIAWPKRFLKAGARVLDDPNDLLQTFSGS